jgi:hypothetical protein
MVSTAHYPWKGNAREVESGENVRIGAAKATARAVQAWQSLDPAMPVFFTGTLALLVQHVFKATCPLG